MDNDIKNFTSELITLINRYDKIAGKNIFLVLVGTAIGVAVKCGVSAEEATKELRTRFEAIFGSSSKKGFSSHD